MIRISNLKLPIIDKIDNNLLLAKVSKVLKTNSNNIKKLQISKKSIDARDKNNISYIISVDIEVENEEIFLNNKNVSEIKLYNYIIPKKSCKIRPLIVGFGPAGFMAGLILSKAGFNPIIIERGKNVNERKKDVESFWKKGILNTNSNVQFGEGGAGTFSDGKLTTGIKDNLRQFILKEFIDAGAPEEIIYDAKPHIGTDKLIDMVKNIRNKIISLGGEIFFETQLIDLIIKQNRVCGAIVKNNDIIREIVTNNVILSIGHSARDTFEMLYNRGINIIQKPFAVGVRIEHKQEMINISQYGKYYSYLPPADYKVAVHLPNKRGVYTFCMCPGGLVVAASSEKDMVVTNGMSHYSRNEENSNSALLVGVNPSDFGSNNPLAGIEFQRQLERKAFIAGGKNYNAPIQTVGDFINNKASLSLKDIKPTYLPNVTFANLNDIFPEYILLSLKEGILEIDKKIKGFANEAAIMTAVESRSSSPIRILRDKNYNSNIIGLIPCGEGCGYAGGIMSAAIDGIHCAESIIAKLD